MATIKQQRVSIGMTGCLCLLIAACSTTAGSRDETPAPSARNVILFIGDGMGVSSVTAIRILDGQRKGMPGEENVLSFERFPQVALAKTYEVNQQVGESSGTATAILTGSKTQAGFIGIGKDAERGNCASARGNHLQTALELAEAAGMSTGVVTTTRLTHATPAAAYAHVPERDWESDRDLTGEARQNGCTDIATQLIEFPYGDGLEVALGGGRIKFLPAGSTDPRRRTRRRRPPGRARSEPRVATEISKFSVHLEPPAVRCDRPAYHRSPARPVRKRPHAIRGRPRRGHGR